MNRAVVIGAGDCLDVPVAELAGMFAEMVLADIVTSAEVRRWEKQRPGRVRGVNWDASGALAAVRATVAAHEAPEIFARADLGSPPSEESDFIVSANCISQHGLVPGHSLPAYERDKGLPERCAKAAAKRHLAWLAEGPGVRLLLADAARYDIGPDGRQLKKETLHERFGLPKPDRTWGAGTSRRFPSGHAIFTALTRSARGFFCQEQRNSFNGFGRVVGLDKVTPIPSRITSRRPMLPPDSELNRWFAEEVQPHEPALRGWLRNRFPSLTDADDLVQESYSRLLRARETGSIACAKAFLFVTARNLALNQLRHLRHERPDDITELDASGVLDNGAAIPESVAHAEDLQLLIQAIQSLPDRCRQIMTLRKLYGLSQKEVAARLGISEHTIEAQGSIGLRKCIEYFRHHGYNRILHP